MTIREIAQALGGAHKTPTGWRARCPGHDDHHGSLDLRVGDKQPVILTCRVCGPEGQTGIIDALKSLGLWSGATATRHTPVREPSPEKEDDWKPITPIPDDVPPLPNSNPTTRWAYRDAEGRLLGYTERFDTPEGKSIKPFSWCVSPAGAKRWMRKGLPKPHPLYGLDKLAQRPGAPVLVVEGEKKADAGNRLLSSYVAVSWAGGVGRVNQADWTPLEGRQVVVWPDNDGVGRKAALEIQETLDKQTPQHATRIVDIPVKFPHGWDIADAEEDGWTPAQTLSFVEVGSIPPAAGDVLPDAADPDNRFYVCLGWDHDLYYFRSIRDPQVVPRTSSSLANKGCLLALAPLTYWEARFIEKSGVNWTKATDDVIQRCKAKGIYNPGDVRGRGAWTEDDGRLVLHTGKKLHIDGVETSINDFQSSRYSYEASADFGLDLSHPLNDLESIKILQFCRSLRWRVPVSGDFLAGWIVLAPFSGALVWRPHIWVTGAAGAGKTVVVTRVIKRLVAIAIAAEGATTAAGLRGELRKESRPVLFDEIERGGTSSASRIEDVIELIMSASSSEGRILKGTAHQDVIGTQIRSCFCLASINTALDRQGIARRVAPLEMLLGDPAQYATVDAAMNRLPKGESLIARTMRNFNALRNNIQTFRRAVSQKFNNQPMGDQFGPLLAGAYSLVASKEITAEQAKMFVEARNWEEHKLVSEDKDENQAVQRLLAHVIRMARPDGTLDRSIGELVQGVAADREDEGVGPREAHRQLKRVGIVISKDGGLVFVAHKNAELEKVFRDTQWAKNWRDSLNRIPGAERNAHATFASGRLQGCISIPLPGLFNSEVVE